ncbi:DUF4277 domain-containing protein, partial [Heliobacterium undosum]
MDHVTTPDTVDVLSVGGMPIFAEYCRELGIREIVNDMLRWDKEQWSATPGDLMVAMLVNLMASRTPLYLIRK